MSLILDDEKNELSIQDLLRQVITELQILNAHMAIASDEVLTEYDIKE